MRLLLTIAHYFGPAAKGALRGRHGSQRPTSAPRIQALTQCLHALHQLYGPSQCTMQLAERRTVSANQDVKGLLRVLICTSGTSHLIEHLPVEKRLFEHITTDCRPDLLGYECQALLRDHWGDYDYYAYLEDDLVLHDPWFFVKLAWFNRAVGDDKLLQPNRYERGPGPLVHKAYVDGDLEDRVTERFQRVADEPHLEEAVFGKRIVFLRTRNPHSGCYFLNADQMKHWIEQPFFCDRATSFIGPLESAATLGVMRAFKVYKPAPQVASFLEIEHFNTQFLSQIRRPTDRPGVAGPTDAGNRYPPS